MFFGLFFNIVLSSSSINKMNEICDMHSFYIFMSQDFSFLKFVL